MPKQWWLITLYMIFIYCVFVVIIEYTKRHPLADERVAAPIEQTEAALPAD